jgi:hypothetical protein
VEGDFTSTVAFVGPRPANVGTAAFDVPPAFLKKPDPRQLLAVYPTKAGGREGEAQISCEVDVSGVAGPCEVLSETPPGLGFGPAAITLGPTFLLSPATKNGLAVPGRFTVTIKFSNPSGIPYSGPTATVTAKPYWISAPTEADMAAAFPKSSRASVDVGVVALQCRVQRPWGTLSTCAVINAGPANQGFENAATNLTRKFRVHPAYMTLVKGDLIVTVSIRFLNPDRQIWNSRTLGPIQWTQQVKPVVTQALYPNQAAAAGVKTGTAVVDCVVAPSGALTQCAPVTETPQGLGFGAAATAIMGAYVLSPWTVDGLPVDGLHVRMPVRLNEAEDDPAPPTPATKP